MRHFTLLAILLSASTSSAQLSFCSPQGNVALFSNYDGGPLTINVDQDIPDLHIGIVSYEFAVVNIVGPYAQNVVAVWWAGFNGENDHCGTGAINHATSITGAPAGTAEIMVYPPATLSNPNGYGLIICNYSCDITSVQGGCNTADQIAHFFLSQWGGVLLFHRTQYACWEDVWNISDGGNCCEDPLSTSIANEGARSVLQVTALGDLLWVESPQMLDILDQAGRIVMHIGAGGAQKRSVNIGALAPGPYIARTADGRTARFMGQP